MDWLRAHPRLALALALLVLALVAWRLLDGGPRATTTGPYVPPTETPSAVPGVLAEPPAPPGEAPFLPDLKGFGSAPGAFVTSQEQHRLRIEVSSESSIPGLRYYIPTSQDNQSGERSYPGATFGLSTTVYGQPAYAAVWVKAFMEGPVTCRIYVDGVLTSTETTVGRTGTAVCRG